MHLEPIPPPESNQTCYRTAAFTGVGDVSPVIEMLMYHHSSGGGGGARSASPRQATRGDP